MPYVSCRYAPPPPEGMPQMILCIDEQGVEWTLSEDSEVGDWLRFVKENGEVLAYEEPD